jgi:hypothetical protein
MANNKDFVINKAVEVNGAVKINLGTISDTGSAQNIDLSTGNYFTHTQTENTSYTISNAGSVQFFQLEVINNATAYTITWPASVDWQNGSAPASPSSNQKNIYSFVTDDGGTSYIGSLTGKNIS